MEIFGKILFVVVNLILYWANSTDVSLISHYYLTNSEQNSVLGYFLLFIFESLYTIIMISYFRSAFSDPGYMKALMVPTEEFYPKGLLKDCKYCEETMEEKTSDGKVIPRTFNIFKPPRAHHCKTCNRCVFRMDHHCEWINNCVGYRNQKYFILFLIYTLIFSSLTFLLLCFNGYIVISSMKNKIMLLIGMNLSKFGMIMLGIFALFFIFMCVSFLRDQYDAINENQTTVESYKYTQGRPHTFIDGFQQIFGYNSKWKWLLPIQPDNYHINYLELLYKYVCLPLMSLTGFFNVIFLDALSNRAQLDSETRFGVQQSLMQTSSQIEQDQIQESNITQESTEKDSNKGSFKTQYSEF